MAEREGRVDRTVALVLPGMTMNATLFPQLGVGTLALDFNDLVLGPAGESELFRALRMRLYVRLLRDRLRDEPPWIAAERRVVVAHSFGGMLALAWQLDTPLEPIDEVHGLVLISTTAGPMFDRVRLRIPNPFGHDLRVPLKRPLDWWNSVGLTKAVKRLLTGGKLTAETVDFRALPRTSDWSLDRAGWRNTGWRAMRSYRVAMMGFDVRDRLANVTIPTVVLHGDRDSLLPLDAAQDLATRLPRAELRIVGGAGHGLPLTHGRDVVAAVRDVIDRTSDGSG